MKKYGILLVIIGLLMAIMLLIAPVRSYAYAFGGRIASVNPPFPYGPCFLPSITVAGIRAGTFLIPPGQSYRYHLWQVPGVKVLGIATGAFCMPIIKIGTSAF